MAYLKAAKCFFEGGELNEACTNYLNAAATSQKLAPLGYFIHSFTFTHL